MRFSISILGQWLLILILSYFAFQLLTHPSPWILIDSVNLLIHEAGHLIFFPFGQLMHMIGGTVFQLLIPCIFLVYFLNKREYFSTFVQVFWVANNLINISVYIKDAKTMQLPLLIEGSVHDWNWILTELNLMQYSEAFGNVFFILGAATLIISFGGMMFFTLAQLLNND